MTGEEGRRDCAWLAAGALLLRLAALFILRRVLGAGYQAYYDDGVYVSIAQAWAGLGGQDIIAHPPGYPAYLVPFLLMGPHGLSFSVLFQILLSACVPPLAYLVARTLGATRPASLWAGFFCVVNPMLVYFSTRIMTETLFVFLVMVFFLLWLRAWERQSPGLAAAAGLVGGAAALSRGVILPFGGVLALAAFWRRRQNPRWFLLLAACGGVWALTMAPWTIYNARRFGRFVPVSVQGGWNFYEGLTTDLDEIHHARAEAMAQEARALGLAADYFAMDDHFAKKAKAWIRENPGAFARLCVSKAVRFWRPWPYPPHPRLVRIGAGIFYVALFGLVLAGLWLGAAAHPAWIFPLAWCVFLTAMHSLFASNLRYRLPLEPMLAILAGGGLAGLLARRK